MTDLYKGTEEYEEGYQEGYAKGKEELGLMQLKHLGLLRAYKRELKAVMAKIEMEMGEIERILGL